MTADRRMTLIAAAACAATSLMVYPLFVGWQWLAVAAGAVIAVAAAGSVTRLRAMPVLACLAGSLAGLLLYLNLVFEARHSLLLLIPTPESLDRLRALAGTGVGDAATHAHPAPDLPGLLLLTAGGVGITAVLADLIAVRLRSAALAGLPLLVLFTVPAMIDPPHSGLGGALVCCLAMAGYLVMLNEDGRERIRGWGRLISVRRAGTGPPRGDGDEPTPRRFRGRGRDPGTWAAAGWRAGLIAIVLAFGAPLLAPSLHLSSLLSSDPGPGVIAAAFARPDESHPATVFTYTTSASPNLESNDAQYFREYVFDTLSSTGWQMRDYAAGAVQAGSIATPPGASGLTSSLPVKTTVTVGRNFSGPGQEPAFLPLPSPATAVSAPGKWLADADLMVYSTSDSIAGQTYSVQSLAVDPTPAQLQAAPGLTETAALAPDLELPSSYETAALKNVARQHADGQSTEFGQVDALANWLSGPQFRYSEAAVAFDDAAGLSSFLTNTRSGFCVHYAYAMTVLTRLLGIPARMVTGFTAGTRLPNGRYVVTSSDAHAWTEVYFPTLGWIRFEPTPGGGGTANAPNYMTSSAGAPLTASPGNAVTSVSAVAAGQPPDSSAGRPQMRRNAFGPGAAPVGSSTDPSETAGNSPAALVLAVIAAVAIALITPAAARGALRRRRWSRAADDASRAHVAWREFLDDLADHGLGARHSEPPRTAANRVAAGMSEPVGAAICRLAQAEERASYSVRASCSRHLRRDGAAARRGLAARARRGARWRARLFPASVMTAVADAIVRLPSGAAGLTRRRPRRWTELAWDCIAAWLAASRPPFATGSADGGWGGFVQSDRWFGVGFAPGTEPGAGARAADKALARSDAKLLIVFCSPSHDLEALLREIRTRAGGVPLIGCTTAGVIAGGRPSDSGVAVTALGGDEFAVETAVATDVSGSPREAGALVARCLPGRADLPNRVLLLLTDGLAGDQQEIVRGAYGVLGAAVPLVGGCAGDDLKMMRTFQLYGDRVFTGSVVAAGIASAAPLGIGVRHGWRRSGEPMLVTASVGDRVVTLDDRPALDVYLERLGVDEPAQAGPEWLARLALTHPLGLGRPAGEEQVRFIVGGSLVERSLLCIAEVPQGGFVWIMEGDARSVLEATDAACHDSLAALGGRPALGMIAFDCIARRGVLGDEGIQAETGRLAAIAAGVPTAGFYTYGEIARTRGPRGFHNQTLVVLSVA